MALQPSNVSPEGVVRPWVFLATPSQQKRKVRVVPPYVQGGQESWQCRGRWSGSASGSGPSCTASPTGPARRPTGY